MIREAFDQQPPNKKMIVYTALICSFFRFANEVLPVPFSDESDENVRTAAAAFLFHEDERVRKLFVSELLGTVFFLTWIK